MSDGLRTGLRLAIAAALIVPLAVTAVAQEPAGAGSGTAEATSDFEAPRTPWGAPDLQGIWDYRTATPLQRPEAFGNKATLTDEEVAEYERTNSERLDDYDRSPSVHAKWWLDDGREMTADRRTSLIVDPANGRIPATTEAARSAARERNARRDLTNAVQDRSLGERCITFGVPRLPGAYNNNYQIVQTPTHVAIMQEMIHAVRIVPLDRRPHLTGAIPQWHGSYRGYYDGDTLVVESTNFDPDGAPRGASAEMRLTERFTRIAPDVVEYEVTFDDPATWDRNWTAVIPMRKTDQPLFEYACHEGNRGLENIVHNYRYAEDPDYQSKLPKIAQ